MSSTSSFSYVEWLRLSSREACPEAGICHEWSMSSSRVVSPPVERKSWKPDCCALAEITSLCLTWWQRHPPCVSENSAGDPCSSRESQGEQKSFFVGLRLQGVTLQTGGAKDFFGCCY